MYIELTKLQTDALKQLFDRLKHIICQIQDQNNLPAPTIFAQIFDSKDGLFFMDVRYLSGEKALKIQTSIGERKPGTRTNPEDIKYILCPGEMKGEI